MSVRDWVCHCLSSHPLSVCMSCPVCHPLILSRVCVTTCVTFLFVLRWYLEKLSIAGVTAPCTPILNHAPSQCQLAFVLCQNFIFYLHDSVAMWVVIKAFRVLFLCFALSAQLFTAISAHIFGKISNHQPKCQLPSILGQNFNLVHLC